MIIGHVLHRCTNYTYVLIGSSFPQPDGNLANANGSNVLIADAVLLPFKLEKLGLRVPTVGRERNNSNYTVFTEYLSRY